MEIVFFVSIFIIFYAYCGYPILLALLTIGRRVPQGKEESRPCVCVLIPAYNEEEVIAERVRNCLETDYPADKIEVIVISDGSTDGTIEAVAGIEDPRVRLIPLPDRVGKSAAINKAVKETGADLLLFTDANALFRQESIPRIVDGFTDPEIGLVTGWTAYRSHEQSDVGLSVNAYGRFELWLKERESRLHSCAGADGAIFAMRRALFEPLAPDDINDLALPFMVVRKGRRAILDLGAVCLEAPTKDLDSAYFRQVRIVNRSLRALWRFRDLLDPRCNPTFSFILASHKLVRWIVPWAMILTMISNVALIGRGAMYTVFLAGQTLAYGSVLAAGLLEKRGIRPGATLSIVYHFTLMNAAYFHGWMRTLFGGKDVTWTPSR